MSAVLVLPLHTGCILVAHSSVSMSQMLLETSVLPALSERLPAIAHTHNHEAYLSLSMDSVLKLTSTKATKVLTKTPTPVDKSA